MSPTFARSDVQQAALAPPLATPRVQAAMAYAPAVPLVNVIVTGGDDRTRDSRGTAFLVGRDTWVTAAHVVRDCAAVYVRGRSGWQAARTVTMHASADLAVLDAPSDEGVAALALSDRDPSIGQSGIHVGFAHGQLVSVETSLSAAANVRQAARPDAATSAGWFWSQPGEGRRDPHLDGVSGGPQLDVNGAVQGVTISYAGKPVRLTTVPVASLRSLLPAWLQLAEALTANRIAKRPSDYAARLSASGSVTPAYCAVSTRSRPPN